MRITCSREKLLGAFQTAAAVAPARSPKPILQNVKFEVSNSTAIVLATDLEVGVRVEIPDIEVEAEGSALLPTARFNAILREVGDEKLRLETEGNSTVVRGERSQFSLLGGDVQEFPGVVEFEEEAYHEIPARLLREMIRRTVFATDNDSTRYALGGVLVELSENEIIAVGTDGRRLAAMQGPAQAINGHATGDSATIIPVKSVQLLERVLSDADAEIRLAVKSNSVLVRTERTMIYSRLVEGRFPKWRDVIPQREGSLRIDLPVGPLHSAVRQAQIVTSEESRGVDFSFGEGQLRLSGRSAELGESQIDLPIAYDGEPRNITLDPRYVAEFLRVLDPEKTFSIDVADSESAAVCSTDDGYRYVIMPLARDQ